MIFILFGCTAITIEKSIIIHSNLYNHTSFGYINVLLKKNALLILSILHEANNLSNIENPVSMILPTNGAELNNAMIDLICTELCFADLAEEELNYFVQYESGTTTTFTESYILHMDSRAIA